MGRVQAVIVAAFGFAFAPGCITVKVDWPGKKDAPPETATLPDGTQAKTEKKADGGVKQAAAFLPAGPVVSPSLPKLLGKTDAKPATNILTLWRDKVEYLPDPTKNGAMGAGIVGQLFLYSADLKFVTANGNLTIEMYDETQKGRTDPPFLGKWTFNKEVLRQLITVDERWGQSYALFLPWPDYKADITRVKLTVRYDQEGGFPIWAPATTVTFNQKVPGMETTHTSTTITPGTFPASNVPSTPVNTSTFKAPENLPIGGTGARGPASNGTSPTVSSMPLPIAPTQPLQPQGPNGLPPIVTIAPH